MPAKSVEGADVSLIIGLFVWTLAEYLIHRFVLHDKGGLFWPSHFLHHRDPLAEVGVPYVLSINACGAVILMGFFVVGEPGGLAAIGFSLGYGIYVALHEGLHRCSIRKGHPLWRLKALHVLHHQGRPVNFGVTSPLWDLVFGTYRGPPA